MRMELPRDVIQIIDALQDAGFEAYAVGGCVRDALLGRAPSDWDITTSAFPDDMHSIFPRTVDTGVEHGTVTVLVGQNAYEVTTYRIDGPYEDGRHPSSVTFTRSLTEDLRRRDFTINAMAYSPSEGLVDIFGGADDLQRKIIRCVGNPHDRFGEDALRMLRAVRFAAQLGFSIDGATRDAIRELSGNLEKVSAERIQAELVKLLVSDNPEEMRTAWELGLTAVFLPEFDRMMDTPQNNRHHCYSVGEHVLHALSAVRPDKVMRLAVLLHDIGKPDCVTVGEDGQDHFHGHPELSAQMAHGIMRRLKFDNDTTEQVCALVRWHDTRPEPTDKSVRRMASRVGAERLPDLLELQRADVMAQSVEGRAEKLERIDKVEEVFEKLKAENQCMKKSELAINGHDIIALGASPGPGLGAIIDRLFEQVLDEPDLNTREQLLELAKAEMQKTGTE
ncbi:MAG: CCA tRNA nucleotidyltransferase [Clostridiales bacterium]|nr:CCA tRNA nucleotidyltransferase [Clostridiales bacterium]